MPGYGTSAYGTTTYGWGASSAGFWLDGAFALGESVVRATFSRPPRAQYGAALGDAINPDSWIVRRVSDGQVLDTAVVYRHAAAMFDVQVEGYMGSVFEAWEIDASAVVDGAGVGISKPRSAQFRGALRDSRSSVAAIAAAGRATVRDLRNPLLTSGGLLGTLTVGADGDYALHAGAEVVRKLILRRLITSPGELRHAPDYGVGLRIKEPIPTSDLGKLKLAIQQQVTREPEVEAAAVTLQQGVNSLLVSMRVKLRQTGVETSFAYTFPFEGVQL